MSGLTFFFFFIPLLALILLLINFIFAPHKPNKDKDAQFECGFSSFTQMSRLPFSISFFIYALLFLLFDLEILLVYPYVVSAYNNASYGLIIMLIFFILLTIGFIFELGKKALYIDSKQYAKGVKVSNKEVAKNQFHQEMKDLAKTFNDVEKRWGKIIAIPSVIILFIVYIIITADVVLCDSGDEASDNERSDDEEPRHITKEEKGKGREIIPNAEQEQAERNAKLERTEQDKAEAVEAALKNAENQKGKQVDKGAPSLLQLAKREIDRPEEQRRKAEFIASVNRSSPSDYFVNWKTGQRIYAPDPDVDWVAHFKWDGYRMRNAQIISERDENQDMARAIALSLEESRVSKITKEETDLEKAIRLSRQEMSKPDLFAPSSSSAPPDPSNTQSPSPESSKVDPMSAPADNMERSESGSESGYSSDSSYLSSIHGGETPERMKRKLDILEVEKYLPRKPKDDDTNQND